jgi:predicted phage tail protein
MKTLIYICIQFPVGLLLFLAGWSLVISIVLAPIGAPMIAAGVLMMRPPSKRHSNKYRA